MGEKNSLKTELISEIAIFCPIMVVFFLAISTKITKFKIDKKYSLWLVLTFKTVFAGFDSFHTILREKMSFPGNY